MKKTKLPLTVGAYWTRMEEHMGKQGAPSNQLRNMKAAFYAGVSAVMEIAVNISHEDISDGEFTAAMEGVMQELSDYADSMGN